MVSPAVSRTLRFMAGIPDEDQPDFASSRPFTDNSLPFDARDIDGGPREAPPVPAGVPTVGVSPTIHDSRQTDEGPREYRPPAPVYADPTIADPSYSEQRQPDPIMGPEQPEAALESTVSDALAGPLRAAGEAAREAYNDPFFAAAPQPPRWVKIVSDAMQAFGGKVARQVAESQSCGREQVAFLDCARFCAHLDLGPLLRSRGK